MVIYDLWQADDGYSVQGEELHGDVHEWPPPKPGKALTLRLEELTHFDVNARVYARNRNILRLGKARQRPDIQHLEVHYTCCIDKQLRLLIQDLFSCDHRTWISFTMHAINGFADFFTRPPPLEDFEHLFVALRHVHVLNLNSCPWFRGHGLDSILKIIPQFDNLQQLRLQGWQLDQVSADALVEAFNACAHTHNSNKITLLSLRSCAFLGDTAFFRCVHGLLALTHLRTLNISYCNLHDTQVIQMVHQLRNHPSLQALHLGGNECVSPLSIDHIADWLRCKSCRLTDLNLRALWISYSDDGLLQRRVDLSTLYEALGSCQTLQHLVLSENYLEDGDIKLLSRSVRKISGLSHLDVGDNPFSEQGAAQLFHLVKGHSPLESLRFENAYVPYTSSEAIRIQISINYFNNRLKRARAPIPLALWSKIIPCLQHVSHEHSCGTDISGDMIYYFLTSSTGDDGLMLLFQMAEQDRPKLKKNS